MPRFMLDTNALNFIVGDTSFLAKLTSSAKSGEITLYVTHIQHDEINAIPDSNVEIRAKIQSFIQDCCKRVPTIGAICGIAVCGECILSDGKDIDAITENSPRMVFDALIAATANGDADFLVTDDERLRKRILMKLPRLTVLTNTEFHRMFIE
jgi:hypothetical protein